MEPIGIADSEQLGVLQQALDRYWDALNITCDDERNHVAFLIMELFNTGITKANEIVRALQEIGVGKKRRYPSRMPCGG